MIPGGMVDTGAAWRQETEKEIDLGGGRMVKLLRPDAATFVKCGLDPLCFQVTIPERQRRDRIKSHLQELAKDHDLEEKFLLDLLGMCMLSPKLWTGDPGETPPGHVHRRHLGSDAEILLAHAFEMSGLVDAKAVAEAARTFRGEPNGPIGEPGGDALRGPSEPDPAPESGGISPDHGHGSGGDPGPTGSGEADT